MVFDFGLPLPVDTATLTLHLPVALATNAPPRTAQTAFEDLSTVTDTFAPLGTGSFAKAATTSAPIGLNVDRTWLVDCDVTRASDVVGEAAAVEGAGAIAVAGG